MCGLHLLHHHELLIEDAAAAAVEKLISFFVFLFVIGYFFFRANRCMLLSFLPLFSICCLYLEFVIESVCVFVRRMNHDSIGKSKFENLRNEIKIFVLFCIFCLSFGDLTTGIKSN